MQKSVAQRLAPYFGLLLFNQGGATGHVVVLRNGKEHHSGLGWSGWIKNSDQVAVIPTTVITVPFKVSGALTQDNQPIEIAGEVVLRVSVATGLKNFDYTVNSSTGEWSADPARTIIPTLINQSVGTPIRAWVLGKTVAKVVVGHAAIQLEAETALSAGLAAMGLTFVSVSVSTIRPADSEVVSLLGAEALQALKKQADGHQHDRQKAALINEGILAVERDDQLKAAEDRRKQLLEAQRVNDLFAADTVAQALALRLKVIGDSGVNVALAEALLVMAKGGVDKLVFGPELFATLQGASSGGLLGKGD